MNVSRKGERHFLVQDKQHSYSWWTSAFGGRSEGENIVEVRRQLDRMEKPTRNNGDAPGY